MLELGGLLLVEGLGYALATLVAPGARPLERLALAWGLGLGVTTLLLFLLSLAGVPLTLPYVLPAALGLTAILIAASLRVVAKGARPEPGWNLMAPFVSGCRDVAGNVSTGLLAFSRLATVEKVILLAIAVLFISSLVIALYWPIYEYDAVGTFDFRGRAFFREGTVALGAYAQADTRLGFGPYYPLLTSLAHTWVYLLGGANPHLLYPLYYISLVVGFLLLLRAEVSRLGTLVFTLLLASTPLLFELSTIAYTNVAFTFYYGLGCLYLCRWARLGDRNSLGLASLLLALSAWTRPLAEPTFVIAVLLAFIVAWRAGRSVGGIAWVIGAYLAVELPWLGYQWLSLDIVSPSVNLAAGALSNPPAFGLARLAVVLAYLGTHLVTLQAYGVAWILFGLVAVGRLHGRRGGGFLLLVVLGNLAVAIYAGYWLVGSFEWTFFLYDGMKRLLLSVLPLVLYYAATSRLVGLLFPEGHELVPVASTGEAL